MAIHLRISGRVQGVGFRAFTRDTARRLGATGWVRNLPDGRVEAVIEGDAATLDAMLAALQRGPRHGRVDVIDRADVPDAGHAGFEIRR